MSMIIKDAFFPCCGLEFRDRKELLDHQCSDLEKHREIVVKFLRQHARMWALLKRERSAKEMRTKLDNGECDWWEEASYKSDCARRRYSRIADAPYSRDMDAGRGENWRTRSE